jgi:hypothetical protein
LIENLAFILPFFIFQDSAFLKLLMAKFGLLIFFDLATLVSNEVKSAKLKKKWPNLKRAYAYTTKEPFK